MNTQLSRRSELMYKLKHVEIGSTGIVPIYLAYMDLSTFSESDVLLICHFSRSLSPLYITVHDY